MYDFFFTSFFFFQSEIKLYIMFANFLFCLLHYVHGSKLTYVDTPSYCFFFFQVYLGIIAKVRIRKACNLMF